MRHAAFTISKRKKKLWRIQTMLEWNHTISQNYLFCSKILVAKSISIASSNAAHIFVAKFYVRMWEKKRTILILTLVLSTSEGNLPYSIWYLRCCFYLKQIHHVPAITESLFIHFVVFFASDFVELVIKTEVLWMELKGILSVINNVYFFWFELKLTFKHHCASVFVINDIWAHVKWQQFNFVFIP